MRHFQRKPKNTVIVRGYHDCWDVFITCGPLMFWIGPQFYSRKDAEKAAKVIRKAIREMHYD